MDAQSQIPPELLQMLIASGGNVGNMQDKIANQQQMADHMRASAPAPLPGGMRSVSNGRISVAPGMGEAMAGAAAKGMGGYMGAQVPGMQEGMRGMQSNQMQEVLAALIRQKQLQGMNGMPEQLSGPGMMGN